MGISSILLSWALQASPYRGYLLIMGTVSTSSSLWFPPQHGHHKHPPAVGAMSTPSSRAPHHHGRHFRHLPAAHSIPITWNCLAAAFFSIQLM